jgi:hypothetical protein
MKHIFALICALSLLCCFSCSSEKSGVDQQKAPEAPKTGQSEASRPAAPEGGASYALNITPEHATRESTLIAFLQGAAADAGIQWLVNGRPVQSPSTGQFNAADTRRGDKVQARATVQGKEVLSNVVEIRNAPPVIVDARIVSEPGKGGSLLVEASARDADGDNLTLQYAWTRNGEPAGDTPRLTGQFKKGDKISVRITPFDGAEYGNAVVLQREIANLPPVIIDHREFRFEGGVYTYQVKATDPEGDPLTYSLKSSAEGMTIDERTGLITWNVPRSFTGKMPVMVSVTDNHGGEARQSLVFEIKPGK